jgi:hypothetical protein
MLQACRYRTWYFVTVPIALVLEIIGYIFRSFSASKDPYNVIYFVLEYSLIVTAPVFLSAGIYAILSILIMRVGRKYSPLPPKWVLVIFITCDVIATSVQSLGAGLLGNAESKNEDPTTGKNILLGGLAFQVFAFLIFVLLLCWFLWKSKKVILERPERKWFLVGFISATSFVYLRTCFRLVEVSQGVEAYLFTHEHYFAGLEFAPIAAAMLLFNVWHPGRCLRNGPGLDG